MLFINFKQIKKDRLITYSNYFNENKATYPVQSQYVQLFQYSSKKNLC